MKFRAALFDADGVVIRQKEYFSRTYAREHKLDAGKLETFFNADFLEASLGRTDLKELIRKRNDLWHWDGDPQGLLDIWFASENQIDTELVSFIQVQRQSGLLACLATIQEKYRAQYFRDVMFPGKFDDMFISCEMSLHKSEPAFFESIIKTLVKKIPDLQPNEIVYFDDNPEGLETAAPLGIATYLYEDIEQVKAVLG